MTDADTPTKGEPLLCPACGTPVEIVSSDEGTQYMRPLPVSDSEASGLRAAAYWRDGLPFTRAGQLEHSRQHREEPSEHTLIGKCPVAARIVEIERSALSAGLSPETDVERMAIAAAARLEGEVSRLRTELAACTEAYERLAPPSVDEP